MHNTVELNPKCEKCSVCADRLCCYTLVNSSGENIDNVTKIFDVVITYLAIMNNC